MLVEKISKFQPYTLGLLRIVSSLIFMAHGTQKILGFPASDKAPAMFSLPWTAGMLELIGGFLLLIGLFWRPVAFVLSGLMAFAYWLAHAPRSVYPVLNGGDAAILYCFIFLYLVFAGPGRWSVDALRKRA
ncbi:MAG: DoxX family protein [Candidatus Kaistia colombiensis]|nr:MAG: DoxX family protein [Kaistia sp.]